MRIVLGHVPVHLLVHQPERERLVADQRLVVAFGVGDGGLAVAAVGEHAPEFVEIPVLVAAVLEQLDPVVRDAHGEAVGEADAAVFDRPAEARHAGHVLGDGDGAGFHVLDELGGELQIEDRVLVGVGAEVIVITAERLVAARVIEHRGDAIEAEAVEAELLQPVADVGEQELADLRAAVVEAFRIPRRVLAARAAVEILVAGAVEVVEALGEVLHGVRVDDVEQHGEAEAVGGIDEVFQVLRRAEARAWREERARRDSRTSRSRDAPARP